MIFVVSLFLLPFLADFSFVAPSHRETQRLAESRIQEKTRELAYRLAPGPHSDPAMVILNFIWRQDNDFMDYFGDGVFKEFHFTTLTRDILSYHNITADPLEIVSEYFTWEDDALSGLYEVEKMIDQQEEAIHNLILMGCPRDNPVLFAFNALRRSTPEILYKLPDCTLNLTEISEQVAMIITNQNDPRVAALQMCKLVFDEYETYAVVKLEIAYKHFKQRSAQAATRIHRINMSKVDKEADVIMDDLN